MKNDRFLKALRREPVDKTPIWIMRQAGRYLPEYRKVRSSVSGFVELCQTPELACEVTLQPLRRFELDASIVFSDILTIPDAMGLGLYFETGEGPKFKKPVQSEAEIAKLGVPSMSDLDYVAKAVQLIKPQIDVPLIGFSGSPWTLACYMIEGQGSKTFSKAKGLLYKDPAAAEHLLNILTESVMQYLQMQVDAGADVVMIFDTWGGLLSTELYQKYSLNPMSKIIKNLNRDVPVVMFTKGGANWLDLQVESGAHALGLDWAIDMAKAKAIVGDRVALQGNLDPCALYGSKESLKATVEKILKGFGNGPGHVFNLGHGIYPDVDPAQVEFLVNTVHEISSRDF